MKNPFKAFNSILEKDETFERKLGCKSPDEPARLRRLNAMFMLRGGRGFRTPKAEPRVDAQGLTRGDRKRKRYAAAFLGA